MTDKEIKVIKEAIAEALRKTLEALPQIIKEAAEEVRREDDCRSCLPHDDIIYDYTVLTEDSYEREN